jgi:hypothetical protein
MVAARDANSVCRGLVQSRARQQADGLQKNERLRSLPTEALQGIRADGMLYEQL